MSASIIFLVIVILVTATLVYLYFNNLGPWKKENSPAPAPAQTQVLPSITDFSVGRTLLPDSSRVPYTIEPYTIEPYDTEDILALSKNVTFTLNWMNNIGFEESGVNKIEVYHGVMPSNSTSDTISWNKRKEITDTESLKNFAQVSVSLSNENIDLVGKNFFKIEAVYSSNNNSPRIILYDSYDLWSSDETDETEESNLGIDITRDDLVLTIDLSEPLTVMYRPRLSNDYTSIGKEITNKRYNFSYFYSVSSPEPESTELFTNVRLVPVDDLGTQFKLENDDGYFKLSDDYNGYSFNGSSSDASTVYIAESLETNTRDFDKVILLKVLIGNESYYLFGGDNTFRKINDVNFENEDHFFRRNIYIKEVSQT